MCPKCLLSIKCPQVLLLRTPNIFQCEWLLIANCNASVSATLRPRGALLPRIVINLVIQKCTQSQAHIHSTLSLTHTHSQALESGINSSRVAVARRPDPAWQAVMSGCYVPVFIAAIADTARPPLPLRTPLPTTHSIVARCMLASAWPLCFWVMAHNGAI